MDISLGTLLLGIVAALMGFGVLLWFVRDVRVGYGIVGAMLFVTSIGVPVAERWRIYTNWLAPIGSRRTELVFVLSALLILGLVSHFGKITAKSASFLTALLLASQIYAGILRMSHETVLAGMASIALALLTIVPMMLLVPTLLREWRNFEYMLRALAIAMFVWSQAVLVQMVINRSMLFATASYRQAFRFSGLLSNPQQAAALLAVIAGISMWLVLNGKRGITRWAFMGLTGACIIMLAWTGSRTGGAMFLIMTMAVIYARAGRAVLLMPVVGVIGVGLYKLATNVLDFNAGLNRLVSTEDTRTQAWLTLIDVGAHNPVFGVGVGAVDKSENSYLYGFASYGAGMFTILLIITLVSGFAVFKLWRARHTLDPQGRRIVDLLIGFYGAYFAGAMFEGYMIARVSPMSVLWIVFSGMTARVLTAVQGSDPLVEPDAPETEHIPVVSDEYLDYGEDVPEPATGR